MLTKKITRERLRNFLKKYSSDEKILDIGSGGSSYQDLFPNRLTLDIDEKRKPEIVGDAHDLPFEDNFFSFVLCTEVLEHTKDPRQVVSEINRVLKTGGIVVLTTRFMFPIHDAPHDYWRFTPYSLQMLFKEMEVLELVPEVSDFSAIAVLLQRMGYQYKFKFNKIIKFSLFFAARVLNSMNFIIVKSFGDIKRETEVKNPMASGYYVVARKK